MKGIKKYIQYPSTRHKRQTDLRRNSSSWQGIHINWIHYTYTYLTIRSIKFRWWRKENKRQKWGSRFWDLRWILTEFNEELLVLCLLLPTTPRIPSTNVSHAWHFNTTRNSPEIRKWRNQPLSLDSIRALAFARTCEPHLATSLLASASNNEKWIRKASSHLFSSLISLNLLPLRSRQASRFVVFSICAPDYEKKKFNT